MITVIILNYNSSIFIDNLLYSLEKLTHYPYIVKILDNNSSIIDYNNLKNITKNYNNVSLKKAHTTFTGSYAHGEGLNKLFKDVKTKYCSIIDPDAVWLVRNWDKILIRNINNKVKAIGTQANSSLKPMDFPLVFAMIFETKTFKKLNINFKPGDLSKYEDVGYESRKKLLKAGYLGKVIKAKNTREYKKGPFNELIGVSEYYFNNNYDRIFASHFGRGSISGSTKYLRGTSKYIYSIPYIGKKLLKNKGIREIEKWIDICKSLVDAQ